MTRAAVVASAAAVVAATTTGACEPATASAWAFGVGVAGVLVHLHDQGRLHLRLSRA